MSVEYELHCTFFIPNHPTCSAFLKQGFNCFNNLDDCLKQKYLFENFIIKQVRGKHPKETLISIEEETYFKNKIILWAINGVKKIESGSEEWVNF